MHVLAQGRCVNFFGNHNSKDEEVFISFMLQVAEIGKHRPAQIGTGRKKMEQDMGLNHPAELKMTLFQDQRRVALINIGQDKSVFRFCLESTAVLRGCLGGLVPTAPDDKQK